MRWVVVGAGAGGCVVAARLAEAGETVVLVEAGAGTTDDASRGASFFDAAAAPGRTFPEPFLRGRGVGGSSAVNGMVATPGDLEQYRQWGWNDAPSAFAKVRVPSATPGDEELGPIDQALLAAAPDAERAALTRRDGRRVTAFDAYITDRRAGIELLADAPVLSVCVDGSRAVGVELVGGTIIDADAVVLCAGAIGSPLLLAATAGGVGGPRVGRHLRNHVALPVDIRLRPRVSTDVHGLVAGTLLRRGDLQLLAVNHLGPGAPGMAGFLVVVMAPTGLGAVTVGDGGPTVDTVLSAHDDERLAAGLRIVEELLTHPAFELIVDEVEVGTAPAGVYHPTSTCRMGDVVDGNGAVVDCTGLYVVDASIFPDIPTANTYLPTLMLAERMVGRVLQRQRVVTMQP